MNMKKKNCCHSHSEKEASGITGHDETSCNCRQHTHHKNSSYITLVISCTLWLAGICIDYTGAEWFSANTVRLWWYLAAFAPVGFPILKEAWEHLFHTHQYFNEFLLMGLASAGAFYIGEYQEAVAVMLFYTLGENLQHRAVAQATRHISRLLDIRPRRVWVSRMATYEEVDPQEVCEGEIIEVRPGARVPLDGILLDNASYFDTSALTGESLPRIIEAGREVLAGMLVCDHPVHLRVIRPYEDSTLSHILQLVQEASERKAPAELFIRRFARVYTPVVLILAFLIVSLPAIAAWWQTSFQYVFSEWLYRGLTFLVISCPCALVISIPLGYFSGIGTASRTGILFKGGNYLDAIAQVNCIAFDKTGTLTTGQFEVIRVLGENNTKSLLLGLARSLEEKSTHPIAQAIVHFAKSRHAERIPVDTLKEIPGYGIEAEVYGKPVLLGHPRLLEQAGITLPQFTIMETVVACSIDGVYSGGFVLTDKLKKDALEAIDKLHQLGITDIHLLSGDKKEIVEQVGRQLTIRQAHGDLLPADKLRYISQLIARPGCHAAFAGDGINDAPVLACSHVGIAMGGLGSDAAIESADIIIQTDQPSKVATAIAIGRATRKAIHQNIIGTITVKIIILLAGAWGIASLWGAVFADVGVALLAIMNSVRILRKRF